MKEAFPVFRQLDTVDCGPTCLKIVSKFYGKSFSIEDLREKSNKTLVGVSLWHLSKAAESIGFRTLSAKIPFHSLRDEARTPFIAHLKQKHFVVVYGFKKGKVLVSDPSHGLVSFSEKEFLDVWISDKVDGESVGTILLMEPTPDFYEREENTRTTSPVTFLFGYLRPHRKFVIQLFFGFLTGSGLQLIFPFLTQSIVDVGINNQDMSFVTLILLAQLMLQLSRTTVDFIRGWILLHVGKRVNISLLSDFLIKLMRLPISYFDNKMIGDLLQRINDHTRIERFLTSATLNALFSIFNMLIFAGILAYYSLSIVSVFLLGSFIYVLWIVLFMKRRKDLDHKMFGQMSQNQSSLIQLINGMQEIKLNNCERQKRWGWESVQTRLFKVSIQGLTLNQVQSAGSLFINETKNIFVSFIAAKAVMDGEITLGMMLAIQYIIGQLNAPINELLAFIHTAQDAKISLERLNEIHSKPDEEGAGSRSRVFPENGSLHLQNVSFSYEGSGAEPVIQDISLSIPKGKITAIVGTSGSGKTTILKLLLRFYEPTGGTILLGDNNFSNYNITDWRTKCGAVLQDGYIFSDTIANNICLSEERVDQEKLIYAVRMANIRSFVESLPLTYNTKIGSDGHGLSQGQRQRILIARAIYKDPEYLFFDEATNALDSDNELVIMDNLSMFFENRTVVIVAHRLSTVKSADQIIVLNKGRIVEVGNHRQLVGNQGVYYNLVKNQLELGA